MCCLANSSSPLATYRTPSVPRQYPTLALPLIQARQMHRVATRQKHRRVGTLGDVRVADGTRVITCQSTHTLVVATRRHTHPTLAAVCVVLAFAYTAYATVRTMEDVLRLVVLPQVARVAVIVVLALVHCALGVCTARTGFLVAFTERTLHISHAESVKLGLVAQQKGIFLVGVAVPASDELLSERMNGFEPVCVVRTQHALNVVTLRRLHV